MALDDRENHAARKPRAPAALRALNAVARTIGNDGASWVKLQPAGLIAAAERETGLRDWGPEPLHEPLEILARSINEDARFNFTGRLVAQGFMSRILANRLRMQRDFTQHPEILDVEIRRPVFIVGLPRTGSTLLQRLMARDPQVRWLATWEMMFPSPPPADSDGPNDPRIRQADRKLKVLNWAAPDFVTAHELSVGEPEECISLLQATLVSNAFELMNDLSTYRDWFRTQDLHEPYQYYKRQLQLLSWKKPRDHWVLKCPVHTFGVKAMLEVFPDATFVMTHRDPVSVMPSVCSLFSVVQTLLSDHADPMLLGKEWVKRWAQVCDEVTDLRAIGDNESHFIDVAYRDMIKDPFAVVRGIYEKRGETFTAEAEKAMHYWLDNNRQHKHGKHKYYLEDYGLTADIVRENFARYQERYAAWL